MSLLMLFLTFLKIGAISFGGGYGMISVMRDEVVGKGLLSETEFLDIIGVAESTPGPIAVNMATFVGSTQYGFWGALLCTLGVVIPSFVIILLIAAIFSNLLKKAPVQAALSGIRPIVVGLILATGLTTLLSELFGITAFVGDAVKEDYRGIAILIILTLVGLVIKVKAKKNMQPILAVGISALLGILFYGVFGG